MKNEVTLKMTAEEYQALVFNLGYATGARMKENYGLSAVERMLFDKVIVQGSPNNYTYYHPKEEVIKALED